MKVIDGLKKQILKKFSGKNGKKILWIGGEMVSSLGRKEVSSGC
jgi:hypothetical protein